MATTTNTNFSRAPDGGLRAQRVSLISQNGFMPTSYDANAPLAMEVAP
ncbi:MAG: hypothetical protein GXP05_15435 [Alphaproteobacteria bacterium]|nr:hypothetical protein [Alphaproteobacteria bacterium]